MASVFVAMVFSFTGSRAALFAQQPSISIAPAEPLATIPFVLFHNRVYLPVEVNQKKLELVLDTGAAVSGLSEESASAIQLRTSGKAKLTGNGESHPKIALAKNVAFRLAAAELQEKTVGIMSWEDLEMHEGRRIAGFLGVSLFRRYIVVIDYPAKTLSLYDPRDFTYRGSGEKVPLRMQGGAALFNAVIELPGHEPMPCELAVDSGTYSALRLYSPYVEKHRLLEPRIPGVDSFGYGLGGEFPERLGRVRDLRIGALALKEPVTSFSAAKSGATSTDKYDGTIGGAILSRFRVIFDYPHQQMILEPISDPSEPWPADSSGIVLRATGADLAAISVLHVLTGTPAASAGVKEGDSILAVDGKRAADLGLEQVRLLFTNSAKHHLQLQRGQQNLDVDVAAFAPLY